MGSSEEERRTMGSCDNAAAVTPDNAATLTNTTRRLYVGAAGSVKVDMVGGTGITFAGVPAGTFLDIRATKVYATGTTASSIVALW